MAHLSAKMTHKYLGILMIIIMTEITSTATLVECHSSLGYRGCIKENASQKA
jgi:hypothetical protein